jgi:hypothetical protein
MNSRGNPISHFRNAHTYSKKSHLTLTNVHLTLAKSITIIKSGPYNVAFFAPSLRPLRPISNNCNHRIAISEPLTAFSSLQITRSPNHQITKSLNHDQTSTGTP